MLCLFVWSLLSHLRIFYSYGDVTIAGEGLQILTYARHSWQLSSEQILTYMYAWHSWPLSREGSLTCHNYCDTCLPFIMVISKDLWHSHLLQSIWQWSCHYLFLRLRSVSTEDWTPISHMRGECSTSKPLRWLERFLKK